MDSSINVDDNVIRMNPRYRDERVLVDPGRYEVVFHSKEVTRSFNRGGLIMWFKVVTPGAGLGKYLPRHYNVDVVTKKSFKPRLHSELVREFAAVTGKMPDRLDRIPIESAYKGIVIEAEVRTVKLDSKRRPIPEPARYSVIDRLTGKVTG